LKLRLELKDLYAAELMVCSGIYITMANQLKQAEGTCLKFIFNPIKFKALFVLMLKN